MDEKEVKITDAKGARTLTDQNSVKIDKILDQIGNNAKYGRISIMIMEGQDLLKVSW